MNKRMNWIFSLALILSLFFSGCAAIQMPLDAVPTIHKGVLYGIQNGATVLGVGKAITGELGAEILTKGNNFFFSWNSIQIRGTTAFWMTSAGEAVTDAKTFVSLSLGSNKGQIGEYSTVKELINFLKAEGWQPVSWTTLSLVTQKSILSVLNRATIFIFMFEGTPKTIDQLYPQTQQ